MRKESIMGRSFREYEQKRMGLGALMCCFLMAFTLTYTAPLTLLDLERSMASGLMIMISTKQTSEPPQSYSYVESVTPLIIQNHTTSRSQVYEINGDIRVHGNSSTIFIATTQQQPNTTSTWTVKPYARNMDRTVMKKIQNLTINTQNPNTIIPPCGRRFIAPAVVFSAGGYAGNPFHDFTDVIIPLYLTSRQFNKNVHFLVANINPWWISKYKPILNNLSKYEVIDVDGQDELLCFPRIIVGLKSHKELGIDQSMVPNYSMRDFTKFLRETYSLGRGLVEACKGKRPRLLVVSRQRTRRLRNKYDVAELARSMGFNVSVRELGSRVSFVAEFVNSFDVVVAVHGAGLTNMVFLPENAVVIQIVPFGLENLSRDCYEIPSKGMNLRYLEYRVEERESSLVEKYGVGNEVFDREALPRKGWNELKSLYLDNQDVSIDLFRFKRTLLEAMELVCS